MHCKKIHVFLWFFTPAILSYTYEILIETTNYRHQEIVRSEIKSMLDMVSLQALRILSTRVKSLDSIKNHFSCCSCMSLFSHVPLETSLLCSHPLCHHPHAIVVLPMKPLQYSLPKDLRVVKTLTRQGSLHVGGSGLSINL
jgi:hypothetical protein